MISTTAARAKARLARKNSEISVCVLDEQFPFPYLTVFGTFQVEDEGAVDVMARIGEAMSGRPVPPEVRAALEERVRQEQRVVLRVTPKRIFAMPPRARQRQA